MATSMWAKAFKTVSEHVVLIETPSARGTGFVIPPPPGSEGSSCIITAWHVVGHADEWHEPVKLMHFPSGKQVFLTAEARAINAAPGRDQAIIIFGKNTLSLPVTNLPLLQIDTRYNEGVEIGWLGYPAVAPSSNLCFFCGHISTWIDADEAYLVDGVAINGVSGGPAFVQDDKENVTVIGLVTEYRPNMATGKALPGVSLVRSINPLLKHYTEIQKQLEAPKVQDIPQSELKGALPTSLATRGDNTPNKATDGDEG
jgi:hypothetical protein